LASAAGESPAMTAAPAEETPEAACAQIRGALSDLARAERDEAFALDLASKPGSSTAGIETRLATLLDRTNRLREALRNIRRHASAHDPRVEQCSAMGYKALVEAEKLTSTVEEVLHNREAESAATPEAVRSDAAAPGSAAQP
jgi:hypothetical protein